MKVELNLVGSLYFIQKPVSTSLVYKRRVDFVTTRKGCWRH
jgi:hypothetical protein